MACARKHVFRSINRQESRTALSRAYVSMHVQRDFVSISQGVVLEYQQRSRTNNERIIDHGRGLRRVRANANEVKRYCWNGARIQYVARNKPHLKDIRLRVHESTQIISLVGGDNAISWS